MNETDVLCGVGPDAMMWTWRPITAAEELDVPGPNDDLERMVALRLLAGLRKAGSRGVYRRDVNFFMAWWQSEHVPVLLDQGTGSPRTPIEAKREDLERFLNYLRALDPEPSAATINRRIAVVSSFYERACEDEDVPVEVNPCSRLKRPIVENDARTGLSTGEAGRLMAAARAWPDRMEGTLVLLLLLLGFRVSEAVSLTRSDLIYDGGMLKVSPDRKGKDGRTLLVVDEPDLAGRLEELAARAENLFAGMDRFSAGRVVAKVGRSAGLRQPLFPHLLRHTFVSQLLRDNVSMEKVRVLAGHSSTETTKRYARAVAADIDPVTARLAASFEGHIEGR